MTTSIAIIGAKRGIGQKFYKLFKNSNFKVLSVDLQSKLTLKKAVAKAEIIIISVPIDQTKKVIYQLASLTRKGQLIMDFTSIKEKPMQWMQQIKKGDVLGCHPVFGPSIDSLEKQVIVLTPSTPDLFKKSKLAKKILNFFKTQKAIIKITTPSKHDEMMAIIQGLMHLTTISLINTLAKLKKDYRELDEYSSPIYRMRMDFSNRILNQNPKLYADISLNNNNLNKILEQYLLESQKLADMIKKKQRKSFINKFKIASNYLGKQKVQAEKRTNKIISLIYQWTK